MCRSGAMEILPGFKTISHTYNINIRCKKHEVGPKHNLADTYRPTGSDRQTWETGCENGNRCNMGGIVPKFHWTYGPVVGLTKMPHWPPSLLRLWGLSVQDILIWKFLAGCCTFECFSQCAAHLKVCRRVLHVWKFFAMCCTFEIFWRGVLHSWHILKGCVANLKYSEGVCCKFELFWRGVLHIWNIFCTLP